MFGQQLLEDQLRLFQERLGITTISTSCEMDELENMTVALRTPAFTLSAQHERSHDPRWSAYLRSLPD
jgi:hypothetical protein